MTIKVIIFDFDGTVADTLNTIVTIINRLALEFGYPPVSDDDVNQFKNLNTRQIIQKSGLSILQLAFLLRRLKIELNKSIKDVKPFQGIKEVIAELKSKGYIFAFITSNSKVNVLGFLENNGMKELFDFIYSGTKLFGKSRTINDFLKQQKLSPEEVIYVGDETRDIESAKKSNIKVIAVSWGFNSPEVLAAQQPDFLIQNPGEIIEIISNLQN